MHHPTVSDPSDMVHTSVTEIVTVETNFTWHIILYYETFQKEINSKNSNYQLKTARGSEHDHILLHYFILL